MIEVKPGETYQQDPGNLLDKANREEIANKVKTILEDIPRPPSLRIHNRTKTCLVTIAFHQDNVLHILITNDEEDAKFRFV